MRSFGRREQRRGRIGVMGLLLRGLMCRALLLVRSVAYSSRPCCDEKAACGVLLIALRDVCLPRASCSFIFFCVSAIRRCAASEATRRL